MSRQDHLTFNGVDSIFADNLSNNMLYGVVDFLNWASLNAGGFSNVTRNPAISGVYGGQRYKLRPVSNPNYNNGQIWEGFRGNWVWETGVNYYQQPIHISGVYVNNTFVPNNSGYYINYRDGQVIFDTAISTTSTLEAEYSYRTVNYKPINEGLIPDLFSNSYHQENNYISTSGSRSQLAQLRQQLPLIAVDINTNRRFKPLQLGGGQWCYNDVVFYILAENNSDKNALVDLISLQNDKTIWIYDRMSMKSGENYPVDLNYQGKLVDSPIQYPELVDLYPWRKISFTKTQSYDYGILQHGLYGEVVKTTIEVPMGNI
jgi:hypothetical protein